MPGATASLEPTVPRAAPPVAPPAAPAAPAAPPAAAAQEAPLPQLTHRAQLPIDPSTGQRYTDWEKSVDDLRAAGERFTRSPSASAQRIGESLLHQADQIEKTWGLQKLPGGEFYDPKTNKVVDFYGAAAATGLTPKALDNAAWDRIISGKFPVAGRGIIADQRRQIVENRVADMLEEAGVPAWKLPQIRQDYQTGAAGQRLLNTRAASLALAEGEARNFIPNVEAVVDNLDRTRFPTLNHVIRMVETNTGSEKEIQAGIAMRSFITAYARVLKPTGGVIGVEDMRNASELLNQVWSKGQIKGAIAQFKTELTNAKKGLADSRTEYEKSGHWSVPPGASRAEALRIIAGVETPSSGSQQTGGGGGGAGAGATTAPASAAAPADPLGIR
jgi:hypothetical protein